MLFKDDKNLHNNVNNLQIKIGNQTVEQVGTGCKEKYFKFVGHVLDDSLSWVGHVEHLCKKFASSHYAINSTKHFQTRHNDYNFFINPAVRRNLETFPFRQILHNWNALDLEIKATADADEFKLLVRNKLSSHYSYETDCPGNCFSCRE